MTAKSHLRGHEIQWDCLLDRWIYCDNKQPTVETWRERQCGHCNMENRKDGHDACLGELRGVMNACCGHGKNSEAYVQLEDGSVVRNKSAIAFMIELGGNPVIAKTRNMGDSEINQHEAKK